MRFKRVPTTFESAVIRFPPRSHALRGNAQWALRHPSLPQLQHIPQSDIGCTDFRHLPGEIDHIQIQLPEYFPEIFIQPLVENAVL